MRYSQIQKTIKKLTQQSNTGKQMYDELSKFHFSDQMIASIINYYQRTIYDEHLTETEALQFGYNKLTGNAYELAEVPYVSQQFLDSLVISMPINHPWHVDLASDLRVRSYVNTMLNLHVVQGQSVLTRRSILYETLDVLMDNTPQDQLTDELKNFYIQSLAKTDVYVRLHDKYDSMKSSLITSASYYQEINQLAHLLKAHVEFGKSKIDQQIFDQAVQSSNQGAKFSLSKEQVDVAKQLIEQPVSVLTGYAGTGKSTLLKLVVDYLKDAGHSVTMGAISAKACFNLSMITGQQAKTIASLKYSRKNMSADYFIIDEISMVSEHDLATLINMLSDKTHIILVGDKAQLPAVSGVGVLTSLPRFLNHNSDIYSHVLSTVFRQDKNSLLLEHATALRNQQVPKDLSVRDNSLKYAGNFKLNDVANVYVEATKRYGRGSTSIITPTNSDVSQLNTKLQNYYMHQQQIETGNKMLPVAEGSYTRFYKDDRVLVTKNMRGLADYSGKVVSQVDILNGFVGKVIQVAADGIYVEFDVENQHLGTQRVVECHFMKNPSSDALGDIDDLRLGYAMTVHKAQGSTIPNVIFYLNQTVYSKMLNKELLYTAYTRAERLFFLSDGELRPDVLLGYVQKTAYQYASSFLAEALQATFDDPNAMDYFKDNPFDTDEHNYKEEHSSSAKTSLAKMLGADDED